MPRDCGSQPSRRRADSMSSSRRMSPNDLFRRWPIPSVRAVDATIGAATERGFTDDAAGSPTQDVCAGAIFRCKKDRIGRPISLDVAEFDPAPPHTRIGIRT